MGKITDFSKKFIVYLIRFYRYWISPFLNCSCRFYPSCSVYMMDAIHLNGIFRGLSQGLLRLLRCHPWHPGGFDPVSTKTKIG